MDQRIVEILMYVIGEIQSRRIRIEEIDGISDELMQRGFTQREVATAMALVADRLTAEVQRTQVGDPVGPSSFRVLHEIERQYITPEAFGYLIQLLQLGILDHSDVEALIERCMFSGNLNLGAEEIKMLAATHLLEKDPGQLDTSMALSPFQPWSEHIH